MFEPLALLNTLVTLCLIVGGFVAYRHGFAQTANEVQERVINALQSEIQTLHDRIVVLEKENTHLNQLLTTLCATLKRRGVHVSVEGDAVSVHERGDGSYTCNMHGQEDESSTEATPAKARKRTRKRPPLNTQEEQ